MSLYARQYEIFLFKEDLLRLRSLFLDLEQDERRKLQENNRTRAAQQEEDHAYESEEESFPREDNDEDAYDIPCHPALRIGQARRK